MEQPPEKIPGIRPDIDGSNGNEEERSQQITAVEEEAQAETPSLLCPVVGIGASAGGLEALTQLFKHLPKSTGMVFVLVQHLDPNHESMLAQLLAGHTAMPVEQAIHGLQVEPNHVYVIPPNAHMWIDKGLLQITPRVGDRHSQLPIDLFLNSLASDQKSRSIGVILSGAASDGTVGLESIKAAGGITFAQDDSAKLSSMPRNAIAAGVVDFVLSPEGIARELKVISEHFYFNDRSLNLPPLEGPDLHQALSLLQRRTGVNFTHYKMPTILRRLSRRMVLNHVQGLDRYVEILEQRPAEIDCLFDDLLITVTEFFRDPETYEVLAKRAFPAMLANHGPDDTIRVWVSGCASGKEVYSIAICLIEYLEASKQTFPIQIFGTDVSERSIEVARIGRYSERTADAISAERLKRFFVKVDGGYQISRSVRELCIFSRQDITKDPPLSKMDLVSCRNLLIYLGPILQRRALSVFAYALQPNGCLLLGNSESLGESAEHFVVIDGKHKLYGRNLQTGRPNIDVPPRVAPIQTGKATKTGSLEIVKVDDASVIDLHVDRLMLDEYAPSGFLVNPDEQVVKFRGEVGSYLAPPPGDPVLDVFQLVREEIAFPLRSALQESKSTNSMVRRDKVRVRDGDTFREINLIVRPIVHSTLDRYFLVLFEELIQRPRKSFFPEKHEGADTSADEYQNLASELSSTRAYMQRLVEELRSANEEAQSSNEELQSTNEELQTAKEELQSSNEELTTTNEEMQGRNTELSQVNNDLINLLSSLEIPIVMLNSSLRIRRFTPVAEKALSLISTDVGRPISDLKPRINVPDLEEMLSAVIRSNEAVEREVQDREGRWYLLRAHPYRTSEVRVEGVVVQLLDINQLKISINELEEARDYAQAIIATVREPLLILDSSLRIQTSNRAFFDVFGLSSAQVVGQRIDDIDGGQWNVPQIAKLFERLSSSDDSTTVDVEVERKVGGRGLRAFQLYARRVNRDGDSGLILLAIEDISDRKRIAEEKYRRLFETAKDGIIIIDGETGRINDLNPYVEALFGYERKDLVGRNFWEAEPLREIGDPQDILARLRRDEVIRLPDLPLKSSGQRRIDVEIVANMYQEESHSVAQFNLRDITERKQFDQQMQQTARLESLGILAGGIAHDFNNLLAGILGNAGLALSDAPVNTPYQGALKDIVLASQRAASLTSQMLAYAGKGRFVVRRMSLSEIVHDISSLIRSSIPKTVDLNLALGKDLPLIEADAGQMQQIVMNLIINGAEAAKDGHSGRVSVVISSKNLSLDDIHANRAYVGLRPGIYVVLEVTDNGVGMDERIRNRIFDPFFTTKFTGRGLGLASVQGIVKGHHGAIEVHSSPGNGSTFYVLLPAADKGAEAVSAPPQEPSGRGHGELILVADDEDIVLRTTTAILEHHGYRVLVALNGQEAVEQVRQRSAEISLAILDLTMPLMSGIEALRQIRQIAPHLPVVIASGYDASQANAEFGGQGVTGFIHKPEQVPRLLSIIEKAIRDAVRTD
jgi:two-component system CheB/CheR fusion protein